MDTALWVVQGLLALAFLGAGSMKIMRSREELAPRMAFVEDFSDNAVRAIGVLEVAGAIGLILPMLLDILPVLTPLAAAGLVLTMIGAAVVHFRRSEMQNIAPNVVLGALALFVVWGRLVELPVV